MLSAKINNISGGKQSDHRDGCADSKYCTSRFFIEKVEGPGIARHPSAACASAPLCFPPPARPLPLQRLAPLRVHSLARTHPRRFQSHISPQAQCPGSRFRVFPPLGPGARLRHLPPPSWGSDMLGPTLRQCSGVK